MGNNTLLLVFKSKALRLNINLEDATLRTHALSLQVQSTLRKVTVSRVKIESTCSRALRAAITTTASATVLASRATRTTSRGNFA